MQVSHSRVSTHKKCPYQFKLNYIEQIKAMFNCDPQNALVIGHALHTGIEHDVETAISEYYGAYPSIDDAHILEAMKLEHLIPRVKLVLPKGEHEVKIETEDFVGYIDLLVPLGKGHVLGEDGCHDYYDIYDFKYSNNVDGYMESAQLHLYKYFFELANPGKRIRNLYFVFVPKCMFRQKKKNKTNPRDETIYEFRNRCIDDLKQREIQVKQVQYDPNKVIEYLIDTKHCIEDTTYQKNPTRLCDWCDYKEYCQKGIDYMILPKNERRDISISTKKKIWLYAPPFAGKTTLTDKFPDPLILTTDGNINNVTAPYVHIKDEVTTSGRITNRKFAWEVFKETLEELEKKQNDFKTITLDLVEDTREMCRLYMYDKLGIQHESDSGFGKGWDIIKTEYLSTMRRFFNLDYENIIICSHEDVSKNITKKSGEQITRIGPNIQETIATKLAGMVDIVARIIVNDDGTRTISFKTDSVVFGGGRLNVTGREIPCDYDELMEVYNEASGADTGHSARRNNTSSEKIDRQSATNVDSDEQVSEGTEPNTKNTEEEAPKRKRRAAKTEEPATNETSTDEAKPTESIEEFVGQDTIEEQEADTKKIEEEKSKRRTRKKRSE